MGASSFAADQPAIRQVSSEGIRHSILICGRLTQLINEKSEVVWQVNEHSRDGSVLPNGNILFSANNVAKEMTRDMKVVWRYALAKPNKELGTAWRSGQRQHTGRRAGAKAAPARDHQGRQQSPSRCRSSRRPTTATCRRAWPASCPTGITSCRTAGVQGEGVQAGRHSRERNQDRPRRTRWARCRELAVHRDPVGQRQHGRQPHARQQDGGVRRARDGSSGAWTTRTLPGASPTRAAASGCPTATLSSAATPSETPPRCGCSR